MRWSVFFYIQGLVVGEKNELSLKHYPGVYYGSWIQGVFWALDFLSMMAVCGLWVKVLEKIDSYQSDKDTYFKTP